MGDGDGESLAPMTLDEFLRDQWPSLWYSLVDGIHINDDQGCYVFVNPAYSRLVGYDEQELLGQSFLVVIPGEHREAYIERYRTNAGKVGQRGEFQLERKDGKRVHVASVLNSVLTVGSRRLHAFITRDITDQRALEQQVLHGDRIRALGTLAGGVAHEFNNLLVSILGYAEMIDNLSGDEQVAGFARKIQRAAHRGTQITGQLLPFSRKEEFRKAPVDLHTVLAEVLELFDLSDSDDIAVELSLNALRCWVHANSTQLHQVFLNLFINARDAMPAGGTLQVASIDLDGQIEIRVDDTGHGMDEEVQQRIFEPFFTTKQTGAGTGLGMALVFSTVASHGGTIQVESIPRKGTTIRVRFPYIDK